MTHAVKSGVRGYWLSGQGCEVVRQTPGAFPANIGGQTLCIAQKFFVKPHHFITKIAQPL
jgi:hypothetical protein